MTIEETQNPLVFVECMTFNHANYIEDAMKGFVIQQTEFPFVVSVMDDASTDGEPEVIKRFLEKEFDMDSAITHETEDRIRVVARHKTNENCIFLVLYLKYNHYSIQKPKWKYFWNWRKNAKYIALCEGDDYWIDPLKLQKQVDFLEEREGYSLCCSKAKVFVQEKLAFEGEKGSRDCEAYDSIIRGYNDINTASAVFDNAMFHRCWKELESFLPSELRIDTAIWYWFARNGKIKFFDDCLSVYRVLPNSACHSTNQEKRLQNDLDFIKLKLFFLSHYPLEDAESNGAFISVLMEEIKSVCDFARYLGEQKVRQTKAFEIGNRIKRFLPLNLK